MADTKWKNRIVYHGEQPAKEFLANPRNWRVHPKHQQEALEGILDQVGWVQNVIVNANTGTVIDGHLRIALALRRGEDTPIPFVAVDISEQEEALILATLDPISALAAADSEKFDELLREVDTGNAAIQQMLADLVGTHASNPTLDELFEQYGEPKEQDFWPIIRVQVPPSTYELYLSLIERAPGEDEAAKMAALLNAVDVTTLTQSAQ